MKMKFNKKHHRKLKKKNNKQKIRKFLKIIFISSRSPSLKEEEEEEEMELEISHQIETNNNNNNNNVEQKLEKVSSTSSKKSFKELADTITEKELAEKTILKKKSVSTKSKEKEKKTRLIKKGKTTELILGEPHPNYNEDITTILEEVGGYEKNMGNSVKHKAYMKASTALQLHHKRVESGEEAKKLDGIGEKIAKKIDEILETGKLKKLEKLHQNPRLQAVSKLCKVTGIGYFSFSFFFNKVTHN